MLMPWRLAHVDPGHLLSHKPTLAGIALTALASLHAADVKSAITVGLALSAAGVLVWTQWTRIFDQRRIERANQEREQRRLDAEAHREEKARDEAARADSLGAKLEEAIGNQGSMRQTLHKINGELHRAGLENASLHDQLQEANSNLAASNRNFLDASREIKVLTAEVQRLTAEVARLSRTEQARSDKADQLAADVQDLVDATRGGTFPAYKAPVTAPQEAPK